MFLATVAQTCLVSALPLGSAGPYFDYGGGYGGYGAYYGGTDRGTV